MTLGPGDGASDAEPTPPTANPFAVPTPTAPSAPAPSTRAPGPKAPGRAPGPPTGPSGGPSGGSPFRAPVPPMPPSPSPDPGPASLVAPVAPAHPVPPLLDSGRVTGFDQPATDRTDVGTDRRVHPTDDMDTMSGFVIPSVSAGGFDAGPTPARSRQDGPTFFVDDRAATAAAKQRKRHRILAATSVVVALLCAGLFWRSRPGPVSVSSCAPHAEMAQSAQGAGFQADPAAQMTTLTLEPRERVKAWSAPGDALTDTSAIAVQITARRVPAAIDGAPAPSAGPGDGDAPSAEPVRLAVSPRDDGTEEAALIVHPGITAENLVISRVDEGGRIQIARVGRGGASDAVSVQIRLIGRFEATLGGDDTFVAIDPERIASSSQGRVLDGELSPGPDGATPVPVRGAGLVPAEARAVLVNVQARNLGDRASRIFVHPTGINPPEAATVAVEPGSSAGALTVVPIGEDGSITLVGGVGEGAESTSGSAVEIDVFGYFVPDCGARYFGVRPQKVFDTHADQKVQLEGVTNAPVAQGAPLEVPVVDQKFSGTARGRTSAVVLLVTATPHGDEGGYLTIYPKGGRTGTSAMTVSATPGIASTQLVIVKVGVDDRIIIATDKGTIDVAVTHVGHFR